MAREVNLLLQYLKKNRKRKDAENRAEYGGEGGSSFYAENARFGSVIMN